jgi:ribosomal protein S27AE
MAQSSTDGHFNVRDLFDKLSALPPQIECPKCGFKLMHYDATFTSAEPHEREVWTVALPFCPRCNRDVLPPANVTSEPALPKIQKIT